MGGDHVSDASRVAEQLGIHTIGSHIRQGVEMVGFWVAVALPFIVVGAIAAGLWRQYPLTLTALLLVNIAALVVGQDHNQ